MQQGGILENFLIHLDEFEKEFSIDASPSGRKMKLIEEFFEFIEADAISTKEHADDEAIDLFVTAIANCKARGINSILHRAFLKLEKTAVKYRTEGVKQ